MKEYILKIIMKLLPKTEGQKLLNELMKLDSDNPENYAKISHLNLRLANGYNVSCNYGSDNTSRILRDIHLETYKEYRQKYYKNLEK